LNTDVTAIHKYEYNKLYIEIHHKDVKDGKIIDCWNTEYSDNSYVKIQHNALTDIYRFNPISNDKKLNKIDYTIDLYQGLYVMVTRNVNFDKGIINGTTGTIINLTPTLVVIRTTSGVEHIITYYKDVNENNNTFTKFMPIKLAYAMSIHKSQGATLDAIEVDASTYIFAPGQLYTALSRARNLQSIKLINFDKESIICNKQVKQFYENCLST